MIATQTQYKVVSRESCSFVADSFAGPFVHLAARDTPFAVIARAPVAKIESFKKRMGWNFPWLSSFGGGYAGEGA